MDEKKKAGKKKKEKAKLVSLYTFSLKTLDSVSGLFQNGDS